MPLYNKLMTLFGSFTTVIFFVCFAKSILAALYSDRFEWWARWLSYIVTAVLLFGSICFFYEAFS